jgi:hypothetical protein
MPPTSGSSSNTHISLLERSRYYSDLLSMYLAGGANADVEALRNDYNSINGYSKSIIGQDFENLRAVEIGFGAKPYRIIYFNSLGVDVCGIDMDKPVLNGTPLEFLDIARRNGPMRALKSWVRYVFFERSARRTFMNQILATSPSYAFDANRLVVGNAGASDTWNHVSIQPNIIYSFRVFEHIDSESLSSLIEFLHERSKQQVDTFLYLVITVYTGIIGSHLTEWYPHRLSDGNKRSEPWEHLRQDRFIADTFLNKMTRRDYRNLFSKYFDILADESIVPELGKEFLTDAVRSELNQYDEYELLSNDVLFVLRPRAEVQA